MMSSCGNMLTVKKCNLHVSRGCLVGQERVEERELMRLQVAVAVSKGLQLSRVLFAREWATIRGLANEHLLGAEVLTIVRMEERNWGEDLMYSIIM